MLPERNLLQLNIPGEKLFMPKVFILAFAFAMYFSSSFAQVPAGGWREHLPYKHASYIVESGSRIFCSTSDGTLFSYNKNDNSISKYSKVNGLSDSDITAIGFYSPKEVFIIGYENGNIDLVINGDVINIPDIKRKLIVGDKTINSISFFNENAYLACGFGIVVCDLEKKEIKDSYIFGEGGVQVSVNELAFDGQYICAATSKGIYKADINHPNLSDYNAWYKLTNLPDNNAVYTHLAYFSERFFTVYHNELNNSDEILFLYNDNWELWLDFEGDKISYLGAQKENLLFCTYLSTKIYNNNLQLIRETVSYYARHALLDNENGLWYADPQSGLVRIDSEGRGYIIAPGGPEFRDVGDIKILSGQLWAAGSTEAGKWSGYGAYSFINEKWNSYNEMTVPALEGFLNISKIAINPLNPRHIAGGSYGYGVAEFRDMQLVDIFDETDGILTNVPGYDHGYVLVKGIDFDNQGSLWISLTFNDKVVYKRDISGNWYLPDFNYSGFGVEKRIGEILAASDGNIWLLIERDGLLVFTENNNSIIKERFFTVQNQAGRLLDRVYCIAEDKDGMIWIGTGNGPVIYQNTSRIFEEESPKAYQPEIPRNDGSNLVDFLLSTEKINAIAVDGANQKWLATENSGAFLVSADGKKEILHFNIDNSPLPTNQIISIAVNDKTGEVFFGTGKGIYSYRGSATEGDDNFENVYVFPNPVREIYDGDITVTGLVGNSIIKITDISGNLVYETISLGGQAVWDGKNFRGERVQTGVYLIFCSTRDGLKTHVTKLLFIH